MYKLLKISFIIERYVHLPYNVRDFHFDSLILVWCNYFDADFEAL